MTDHRAHIFGWNGIHTTHPHFADAIVRAEAELHEAMDAAMAAYAEKIEQATARETDITEREAHGWGVCGYTLTTPLADDVARRERAVLALARELATDTDTTEEKRRAA